MKSKFANCSNKELQKLTKKERAASLVEYGLLVALIAVVAMGAVRLFGQNLSSSFSASSSAISSIN